MSEKYTPEELRALEESREAILKTRKEIDSKMSDTFSELEKFIPRCKMSESVFVKKYLKFLSSVPVPPEEVQLVLDDLTARTGRKHTEKDLRANLITSWISDTSANDHLGSGIFYETDIYDDSGAIIFTVPAFAHSTDINERDGQAIVNAAIEASVTYNTDVLRAGQIISTRIAPLMPKRAENKEHTAAWNKIYAHYGLPLIGEAGEVKKTTDTDSDMDSLFEY